MSYELRAEGGSTFLQKRVLNVLSMPPQDPWPPPIDSEPAVLGIDECVLSLDDWRESMSVLTGCPQSVRTSFLKTIINSWPNSHGMSDSVLLLCIFGCVDCEDNLTHYLSCSPLWALPSSAGGLPSCFLSPPPDRLCLMNKPTYGLKFLGVV